MRAPTIVVGLIAVLALLSAVTAPAVAQSTNTTTTDDGLQTRTASPTPVETPPPYYEDNSSSVDSGGWLSGLVDASLDDVLTLFTRVPGYIIGSGVSAQGGIGSASVLLTGGLLGAVVMGTGIRARVGPVGGAVMAVVTTFSFVSVGVGPGWLYAVVLFGVGIVASMTVIRVLR